MKIQKWIQKRFIIPTNLLKAGMVKVPSEMRGGLECGRQQGGLASSADGSDHGTLLSKMSC